CGTLLKGKQQQYCCNACKQKHHYHRVKVQTNTYHSQTIRALRRKRELIELKGGGCSNCGYSKNFSALEFHHLDSRQKKFKLDMRRLSNSSWDRILVEASKCVLLCANCHAETHHPELSAENVDQILSNGALSQK
ncbi:MAG: hypothetical protein AAFR97_12275, partial [Bacteroidota bacterium]